MKKAAGKLLSLLLSAAMLSALALPASAAEETGATEDGVVILYTNDVHTYIDNNVGEGNENGLTYSKVAALKDSYDNALLLDAGDHIQGTAYGSMDKGETIIKLMNAAGYDAATLGNHEFDYGMEGCMQAIEWADYPYLSCNFYHEKDGVAGDPVLDSYKVFEVDGVKIAIVGITTPESFTKSTPSYFQDENGNYIYGIAGGEDGSALYAAVQEAVDAASKEADYVVALGHLGVDASSKPWTSEEVIANTTGLDAFIDGHSHSTVEMKEVADKNGDTVVLTQTGSYLNAVGQMTIAADGTITTKLLSGEDLAEVTPDADVKAIEDAWVAEINTQLGQVIGHISDTLDNYDADGNRLVRKQETNTGDFAADALYYLFDNMDLDVDVAIMNGGGIRNEAITGDISYLTCKSIHTFGNVACLQTVTGQQLLDALEWGAKDATADGSVENGGFLQVSGLKYTINTAIPSTVQQDDKGVWTGGPTGDYRVTDVQVLNNETGAYEPLDLKASYNLAGYNYTLRDLGDGFAMFDGAVNVLDYVMEDYMVLANYVQSFENGEVTGYAQPAGRITLVNEPVATEYPADLEEGAWYYKAVVYALDNGLMNGTNTGFAPNAKVTTASVYQMLYNMEGNPAVEEITVSGSEGGWYTDCINWAASQGLYLGGDTFTGDSVITRSAIARLFANYAEWKGVEAPADDGSMKTKVTDYDSIPAEDLEGMTFCYYAGLMRGNQGMLMPTGELSRAEFAQLLMNFDQFMATQQTDAAA
ncbi:5'-nucleotidase C-terminal domain-containing protein [Flavonifractor sp. An306]|uniref:5'-nucleotidase C-terminal domain-containing protein n=1 Tax=Flavonifractor sp. An306 TaxID=1965629 RepID=UPI00174BF19B|nr:5'-nucleotidase C-terminal domain-containing protein [Flavonifractor sp. An306]